MTLSEATDNVFYVDREAAMEAMIQAEVDRAIEPYRGVLPAEVLEEMADMLYLLHRSHPTSQALFEQLLPREVREQSGKEDVRSFRGLASRKAEGE